MLTADKCDVHPNPGANLWPFIILLWHDLSKFSVLSPDHFTTLLCDFIHDFSVSLINLWLNLNNGVYRENGPCLDWKKKWCTLFLYMLWVDQRWVVWAEQWRSGDVSSVTSDHPLVRKVNTVFYTCPVLRGALLVHHRQQQISTKPSSNVSHTHWWKK